MIAPTIRAPRDLFCVVDARHRDMTVARDACAGRFTHCGVTLATGLPPDWRNVDIAADREWWIEWSKFYVGLDLAHAWTVTGDERFAQVWQLLVSSWIDQVPVEVGPIDALARRLQYWLYAWIRFTRSSAFMGFEPAFEARLAETIAAQRDYLQAHLTPARNHRTFELYALFTIALAFPDTDPDGARLQFAWDALQQNLLTDCWPDGVQREHSTHYHLVALRSWLGARENARRFGLPVLASYDDRLNRAVDFAMHCVRPDGSIPMLSDADTADYRELLALAADLLDRPDAAFVATNGRKGTAPTALTAPAVACAAFSDAGYFVQSNAPRTRHLVFDCGGLGDGGHGHYDALSIDAWAGRPLIVDPGRYTYAEGEPNWRRWFKSTAAHNTVCVDGLDQTAYRSGKPKTPAAVARLLTLVDTPMLHVVGGECRSACYDAVHQRHVLFIAEDYWVIVDRLTADTPHDYDLRFHLSADAWQHTIVDGMHVLAPAVELLCHAPATPSLEDGWIAPQYGIKLPAPVVSIKPSRRCDVLFVTALLPRDDAADERRGVALDVDSVDSDHGNDGNDGNDGDDSDDRRVGRVRIAVTRRSGMGSGERSEMLVDRIDLAIDCATGDGRLAAAVSSATGDESLDVAIKSERDGRSA